MKSVEKPSFIIGIDEAGRGPLAGPVAIGIAKLRSDFDKKLVRTLRGKDSKKLTEQKREEWFAVMKQWKKEGLVDFHVALISHAIIDQHGISYAIRQGIKECLRNVKADPKTCRILLDGSLKAPTEFTYQKTIIKGDEKEIAIGLASIAAKVTRDRHMLKLAQKYPYYRFELHKGYGTLVHRESIKKYGPSAIHRLSFIKNVLKETKKA